MKTLVFKRSPFAKGFENAKELIIRKTEGGYIAVANGEIVGGIEGEPTAEDLKKYIKGWEFDLKRIYPYKIRIRVE